MHTKFLKGYTEKLTIGYLQKERIGMGMAERVSFENCYSYQLIMLLFICFTMSILSSYK